MRRLFLLIPVLLLCLGTTQSTFAVTVDFESLQHGEIVTQQFETSDGLTIEVVNFTGPDAAIVFDSNRRRTADRDLESPFVQGNLAPTSSLGNLLIIAENLRDHNNDGLVDSPDDEGSRPAGVISFAFDDALASFGFDLIDVEGPSEFGADSGFVATFFSDSTELARVGFGSFVDPQSNFFDPTVVFGDNSANRIDPITAETLGINPFNRVDVNFGGSAAIDNIRYEFALEPPQSQPPVVQPVQTSEIPEPASWLVLSAAACLAMGQRHRRSRT